MKEYYIFDAYDIREQQQNGFESRKTYPLIIEKDGEFKEIFTKGKVLVLDNYQTFNGHQFFREHYSLIGKLGKKITEEEMKNYFNNMSKEELKNYIINVIAFIRRNTEDAIQAEGNFLLQELNFTTIFNSPNEAIINEPKIK